VKRGDIYLVSLDPSLGHGVIKMGLGLEDRSEDAVEEVGHSYQAARERIRQIEAKALRKLRHPPRSSKPKAFVNEQQGTRPVLLVSPDSFNTFTHVPIVVPITSGGAYARNSGFTVSLAGAGMRTNGLIRCDQPRPLDIAARNGRRLEAVPQHILDDVLAKLITLFT
jgi:mRNA-degrading endonuclease toxin of MazEF toxin-antitoxin module